jgi:hypothetical protein
MSLGTVTAGRSVLLAMLGFAVLGFAMFALAMLHLAMLHLAVLHPFPALLDRLPVLHIAAVLETRRLAPPAGR